ncbi:MAG: ribosome maturation factor RimP [Gammaproteobacteria bacterium]|nr:ribosome maturation factor RimP [Gammaproteobacteria bacterium]
MTGAELAGLLEPTVMRLGFELADLEVRVGGKGGLIRLYIDKEGGISLEDCERVSRAVGALLEVEDPVPGNYNLEVSSPGLDRKLTKISHFQRFIGETVQVKLRFPLDGRRRFRGTLKAQEKEDIVVEVDGQSYRLPLSMIDTARLVPAAE